MFFSEMRFWQINMKILIVEDEKTLTEMLQITLSQEGNAVDTTYSGEEAEKLVAATPFDVILLDLSLPGKDGLTVCKDFRQQQIWTPVIMLIGRATEADIVKGLDNGADDYLVKPFYLGELLAMIRCVSRRSTGCYN
jgi:two-component system copper resistance phosphate regulon response regulator CusR